MERINKFLLGYREMKKKKYGFFRSVLKEQSLIMENKRGYLYFLVTLKAIFLGVVPVVSVLFTKVIIDVILGNQDQVKLIQTIVVLISISVFCFASGKMINPFLNSSY